MKMHIFVQRIFPVHTKRNKICLANKVWRSFFHVEGETVESTTSSTDDCLGSPNIVLERADGRVPGAQIEISAVLSNVRRTVWRTSPSTGSTIAAGEKISTMWRHRPCNILLIGQRFSRLTQERKNTAAFSLCGNLLPVEKIAP